MSRRSETTHTADYYQVLGVTETADGETIKQSYRRLAKHYHPDVNPSAQAAQNFVMVQQAYEVLSNPAQRQAYDFFRTHGAATPVFRHVTYRDAADYARTQGSGFRPARPKRETPEEIAIREKASQLEFIHGMLTLFLMFFFVFNFSGGVILILYLIFLMLEVNPYELTGVGFAQHLLVIASLFVGYNVGRRVAERKEKHIHQLAVLVQNYYRTKIKKLIGR